MNPREKAYEFYKDALKINSYLTHQQAKELAKLIANKILEALKYPDLTFDLTSDIKFYNEVLTEINLI